MCKNLIVMGRKICICPIYLRFYCNIALTKVAEQVNDKMTRSQSSVRKSHYGHKLDLREVERLKKIFLTSQKEQQETLYF